ncbi:MAG: hypothetical protein Q9177_001090 [Variospora cf. flavescens]
MNDPWESFPTSDVWETPSDMAANSTQESHSNDSIYQQLESHSFANDLEFQSGLSTILSSTSSFPDPELLTLRARCYYFSRKYHLPVDFNAYISWRSAQNLPPVTSNSPSSNIGTSAVHAKGKDEMIPTEVDSQEQQPQAPYPSSFAQIVDLITKGEPIRGIKAVPDTLLTGQESATTTTTRKKPWEQSGSVLDV